MKFNFRSGTARFRLFLILMIVALAGAKLREFSSNLKYFYQRQFSDPSTIRDYFAVNAVRKLHLGAGDNNVVGWLNSDIEPSGDAIYLDASSHYPFSNDSFHYIYAEHLIEHLSWEDGLKMLKEAHRVLAPGGKLRIITPNLTQSIYALNHQSSPEVQKFVEANLRLFKWPETPVGAAYVFNKTMREWGHLFIYDPQTLRKTLELAGFVTVRELTLHEETDPIFAKAEYRTRAKYGEDVWLTNSWGSMAIEATK